MFFKVTKDVFRVTPSEFADLTKVRVRQSEPSARPVEAEQVDPESGAPVSPWRVG